MTTPKLTLPSGPFFERIRAEADRGLAALEEVKAVCTPISGSRFRQLEEELHQTKQMATDGETHGDDSEDLRALMELEKMLGIDADPADKATTDAETQTEAEANASTRAGSSGSATSVSSAASRSQASSGPKENLKKGGAADKPWNRPLKLMPCAARKPPGASGAGGGPSKPGGPPKGPPGPAKGAPGAVKGPPGATKGPPGPSKGPPGPSKGSAGPPRSGQPTKRNPFAKYDAVVMM